MGIQAAVNQSVIAAFSALSDYVAEYTLKRIVTTEHDNNVLKVIETYTDVPFDAIMIDFKSRDIDGVQVYRTDKQLLARGDQFNGAPPKNTEFMYDGTQKYEIRLVTSVPGAAIYILHVRPV